MAELDSPYIIRMIGLCRTNNMLILELASLGPLRDYLKEHRFVNAHTQSEILQRCSVPQAVMLTGA